MARWQGSPQYLKQLQKIRSMSPERRAVTKGLLDELSGSYAGADMKKQIEAMQQAAAEDQMENALEVGQDRLDLREKSLSYADDRNDTAEALGYANIPLAALSGYGDLTRKRKLTGLYQGLRDRV